MEKWLRIALEETTEKEALLFKPASAELSDNQQTLFYHAKTTPQFSSMPSEERKPEDTSPDYAEKFGHK